MPRIDPDSLDVFLLEGALWVAARRVGVPSYDFAFEALLACRRPWARPAPVTAAGGRAAGTIHR